MNIEFSSVYYEIRLQYYPVPIRYLTSTFDVIKVILPNKDCLLFTKHTLAIQHTISHI